MKYMQRSSLVVLLIIFLCVPPAFANTATVSGICYSLEFESASTSIGGDLIAIYYTTCDGDRYSFPQNTDYENGCYYISQKVKKIGGLYQFHEV